MVQSWHVTWALSKRKAHRAGGIGIPPKRRWSILWRCGDLAITRRDGFQKVYDLAERVIPEMARNSQPSRDAMVDWACRSALSGWALRPPERLPGFGRRSAPPRRRHGVSTISTMGLTQVTVECADGSPPRPMFARDDLVELLQDIPPPPRRLRFLSPFDPLIRDRLRTRRMFNFDYRIEVFVPAAQRRYGYYVLPMLQGDRFIGRIDMKHQRQEGQLLVTGLWLEPRPAAHQRPTARPWQRPGTAAAVHRC